jgi:hypothetical protein
VPYSSSRKSSRIYSLVLSSPKRLSGSYGACERTSSTCVSSADGDERGHSDEEEQEEEPAPKLRKRKGKKGGPPSLIPGDAPPALSLEDQMMTIRKNTELGLQATIQSKGRNGD